MPLCGCGWRDTIDPLFLTIRSLHTDISSITIYTDTYIHPHGSILRPLTETGDKAWFEQACHTTMPFYSLSQDGQTLYLVCQIPYNYVPYTSIVCMAIDFQSAMRSAENLFNDNYGFLLTDVTGEVLYQYTSLDEKYTVSETALNELLNDALPVFIAETEQLSDPD